MRNLARRLFAALGVVALSIFALQTETHAQQCVQPPSGMNYWYPGDSHLYDIRGGAHAEGSVVFSPGMVREAFSFNGFNTGLTFPFPVGAFGTSDFTVDFWIKTPDFDTPEEVLNNRTESSHGNFLNVRKTPTGELSVEVDQDGGGTGYIGFNSNAYIADDLFHHVAIVRQGTTLSLYIDGVLDNSGTSSDGVIADINGDDPLRAGFGNFQSPFNGLLDEIEIFHRALTQAEIQTIFNAGSAGKCKSVEAGRLIISEFRFRGPGGTQQMVAPSDADSVRALGAPTRARTRTSTTRATSSTRTQAQRPAASATRTSRTRTATTATRSTAPRTSSDTARSNAPGTPADNDEFIEFYNNSDADLVVATDDGSAGYALLAADGVVRFLIPNGTLIPARGHYLAVNGDGYSLQDYGCPGCANGDTAYFNNIPNGSGIALFKSSNDQSFTLANRLDAVGYDFVDPLYREGDGFPAMGAEIGGNIEYSFLRFQGTAAGNRPKDTNDNLADFISVNTQGFATSIGQRLGAPGPQNLSSPVEKNSQFPSSLLDPSASISAPPNRSRDFTPVPNGNEGTISFRRTFTNNTGGSVDFLVFRIIDITTFPAPNGTTADLRALNSQSVTVTVNDPAKCGGSAPCQVTVEPTTLEEPPAQPAGGGWNSSLIAFPVAPIAPGASVDVNVTLGVMQRGAFRFYINVEAPPSNMMPPFAPKSAKGAPARSTTTTTRTTRRR